MSLRSQTSSRLGFFDSIRGLAALSVVAGHVATSFGLPSWLRRPLDWQLPVNVLWDGTGAVYLFFVLSDLVLALRYLDAPGLSKPAFLREFYLSRALRIYPTYLVVYA